jgi:Amidohydrolase family
MVIKNHFSIKSYITPVLIRLKSNMRNIYCSLLCLLPVLSALAQTNVSDTGSFIIHKFAQPIGREQYFARHSGESITYFVDFHYIDRGSRVKLKDSICFDAKGEPIAYRIRGGTSRFSSVNDSVVFEGKTVHMKVNDSSYIGTVDGFYFPIAGYSPATAQMLLIQYWKRHRFPQKIYTPPFGAVAITKDGTDTFTFLKKTNVLTRFHITGLIWGNELLWTDSDGRLVCLITNDAEGDKQEIVYESYESLLPQFISKAAIQGMKLFAEQAKPAAVMHKKMAIIHARVIDVVNNSTLSNTTILIENGKIQALGKSSAIQIPADAFVLDAKGKTILPGLWDMHAHFEQAEWGPAYLAAGVTTVRDCGNEFDYINAIKNSIDKGSGIGPNIIRAGIIDGKGPYALGIVQADNREEAIKAVRMYKDHGFEQIKIYSSVKPGILKIICTEAHRLGLSVTGHIPMGMNLKQAVDSGMDMVNHVQYVYGIMKRNKTTGAVDFSDSTNLAVMKFLKEHNVVIDPTLGVFELAFRSVTDNITDIEPDFSSLPEPLKPLFINTGSSTRQEIEHGKIIMKAFMDIVNALNKNGITLVAGTDMGFPGYSVYRELELYVASGLSPMEAIQTATIIPARVMNQGSVRGSVEAGKDADLILIDGDPLENIRNIRKVSLVIKDGRLYDPPALHKMAGFN